MFRKEKERECVCKRKGVRRENVLVCVRGRVGGRRREIESV